MPLYRQDSTLIYFAHIPKCAGSSLSTYLRDRFGLVALEDRSYFRDPQLPRWNLSSPQHVSAAALDRLLPRAFYDAAFAVIRHPEARLRSVYQYQKYQHKSIPRWMPFGIWLRSVPWMLKHRPFALDGHLNPQVSFLPDGVELFRLENGLDQVATFLDRVTGSASELTIGHEKKAGWKMELTEADRRLVRAIYAADYETLGYD